MKPSQPRIKICGLKDASTIASMNGLPFHEIGFVFAPSKRQVSKEEAAILLQAAERITGANGKPPLTVGVFVDATMEEMDELLAVVPLHVVQLHGSESPGYCSELRRRHPGIAVWRVFSVGKGTGSGAANVQSEDAAIRLEPYRGAIDAVLIDAPGGGTGEPFAWSAIESYKLAALAMELPLYVAGGLNADNVQQLLRSHAPNGVDVSSGVETEGRKDIDKIRLFVRKVTEA
ncbi:phosphoribosylanthranilate isomerase [Paenibacillus sp. LHD-117]|uniref:phosphoribosylanthranilate isomerase n=1 Tax=Paenibacillus sp. LHD-117 TaxID=3071412 RepID=UPI0027DFF0B9|nr:phosphoribosylanthranilate isomerase [Paenibacillus sp. LHD-117]MDQ6418222.1 phosphoribosylanthranilate isomerase [Paenibacillus sp. LHD-117]